MNLSRLLLLVSLAGACGGGPRPTGVTPHEPEPSPTPPASPTNAPAAPDRLARNAELEVRPEPDPHPTQQQPTITATPVEGTGAGTPVHWTIEMSGFPAIASNGQTIAVGEEEEYRHQFFAIWSTRRNGELRRIILPHSRPETARRVERIQQTLDRGEYRTLVELPVHEATDAGIACLSDDICVLYRDGRLTVRRQDDTEALSTDLPRKRLLLGGEGLQPCSPGGDPEPPVRVSAWTNPPRELLFVRWVYQAFAHGCELPVEYRLLRLGEHGDS